MLPLLGFRASVGADPDKSKTSSEGLVIFVGTDTREERLARRIADLYATDQQFADARPSEAIAAAIDQPGLRLPQIVQTIMEGYADRPALGQQRRVHQGPADRPHFCRAAAPVRNDHLP
jgi:hypothetical protein